MRSFALAVVLVAATAVPAWACKGPPLPWYSNLFCPQAILAAFIGGALALLGSLYLRSTNKQVVCAIGLTILLTTVTSVLLWLALVDGKTLWRREHGEIYASFGLALVTPLASVGSVALTRRFRMPWLLGAGFASLAITTVAIIACIPASTSSCG